MRTRWFLIGFLLPALVTAPALTQRISSARTAPAKQAADAAISTHIVRPRALPPADVASGGPVTATAPAFKNGGALPAKSSALLIQRQPQREARALFRRRVRGRVAPIGDGDTARQVKTQSEGRRIRARREALQDVHQDVAGNARI
jgi:hypothetical protein